MTEEKALVERAWDEVYAFLKDLADEATCRKIVRSVFLEDECTLARSDADERTKCVAVIEATRDRCFAFLLLRSREDNGRHLRESRARELILDHFEAYIRSMVHPGNAHDTDEVVNDVRLRLWRCLETFDGERKQMYRYIRVTVRSACIDSYRREPKCAGAASGREVEFEKLCNVHEVGDDDTSSYQAVETRLFLEENLPLLPPCQQQAVFLHLGSYTWLEGERLLGVPRQTLESRFTAACGFFRTLLEER